MLKDAIKLILTWNGSVNVPFKNEISDWYYEYTIYKYVNDALMVSYNISPDGTKFFDVDEAVDYFCKHAFTSKNAGIVQKRIMEKGFNLEDRLEKPDQEIKNLFAEEAKLVDEEYERSNKQF